MILRFYTWNMIIIVRCKLELFTYILYSIYFCQIKRLVIPFLTISLCSPVPRVQCPVVLVRLSTCAERSLAVLRPVMQCPRLAMIFLENISQETQQRTPDNTALSNQLWNECRREKMINWQDKWSETKEWIILTV